MEQEYEEQYLIDNDYGEKHDRGFYANEQKPCPRCSLMTLEEQTMGYEKVVYCTHCDYSESKTI